MSCVRKIIVYLFVLICGSSCMSPVPQVMHTRLIVHERAGGSSELLTIGLAESVPDAARLDRAEEVKDFGADGSLAAADWLSSRGGYRVQLTVERFQQGGQPAQIFHEQQPVGPPAFAFESISLSPDGAWLLFACREYHDEPWTVWVMKPDGSEPTALHAGRSPTWWDADTLVFVDGRDLWQINLDGSRLRRLVAAEVGRENLHPSISPDGRYLAYVQGIPGQMHSRDIWLFDLSAQTQSQLTSNPSRDDLPYWTADGSALLFRSTRFRRWSVWRISGVTSKVNR